MNVTSLESSLVDVGVLPLLLLLFLTFLFFNCSFIVVAGVLRHFAAAHFLLLFLSSSFLSQTHWYVSINVSEHLSSSTFAAAVHLLLLLHFLHDYS